MSTFTVTVADLRAAAALIAADRNDQHETLRARVNADLAAAARGQVGHGGRVLEARPRRPARGPGCKRGAGRTGGGRRMTMDQKSLAPAAGPAAPRHPPAFRSIWITLILRC